MVGIGRLYACTRSEGKHEYKRQILWPRCKKNNYVLKIITAAFVRLCVRLWRDTSTVFTDVKLYF